MIHKDNRDTEAGELSSKRGSWPRKGGDRFHRRLCRRALQAEGRPKHRNNFTQHIEAISLPAWARRGGR